MNRNIKLYLFTFVLLSIFFQNSTFAQSPYEVTKKQDIPILSAGLATGLTSLLFDFNVTELTPPEITRLISETNQINRFDRRAVKYYSSKARHTSDVFLYSTFSAPFLLLLNKNSRQGYFPIAVMTAEVVLLNSSATAMTKGFARRSRPFIYNPDADLEEKLTKNARLSFYSGHTSVVSSLTFFSAKVFSDYNPDSKWKPVVWTVAATVPAATGYFRIRGGKHFPTDVITGYIAGGLIGYFIPKIHKKKDKDKDKKVGFNIYPGPTSIGMSLTW